jgi:hypothetical protein
MSGKGISAHLRGFSRFFQSMDDFEFLKGTCFLCKQKGELPYARDSHFICEKCETKIRRSIDEMNVTQCAECLSIISRLWVKETADGEFICFICADNQCAACGTFEGDKHGLMFEGKLAHYCLDCKEKMEKALR